MKVDLLFNRPELHRIRVVAALLALFACPGAASQGIAISQSEPNVDVPPREAIQTPPMAAKAEAAEAAPWPRRFDLDCHAVSKEMGLPAPASPYVPISKDSFRLNVDLDAMRYCNWGLCPHPTHIAGLDLDHITLFDDHAPYRTTTETVRRRDGRYEQRVESEGGYLYVTGGTCAVEPFSGIPPILPRDPPPAYIVGFLSSLVAGDVPAARSVVSDQLAISAGDPPTSVDALPALETLSASLLGCRQTGLRWEAPESDGEPGTAHVAWACPSHGPVEALLWGQGGRIVDIQYVSTSESDGPGPK